MRLRESSLLATLNYIMLFILKEYLCLILEFSGKNFHFSKTNVSFFLFKRCSEQKEKKLKFLSNSLHRNNLFDLLRQIFKQQF